MHVRTRASSAPQVPPFGQCCGHRKRTIANAGGTISHSSYRTGARVALSRQAERSRGAPSREAAGASTSNNTITMCPRSQEPLLQNRSFIGSKASIAESVRRLAQPKRGGRSTAVHLPMTSANAIAFFLVNMPHCASRGKLERKGAGPADTDSGIGGHNAQKTPVPRPRHCGDSRTHPRGAGPLHHPPAQPAPAACSEPGASDQGGADFAAASGHLRPRREHQPVTIVALLATQEAACPTITNRVRPAQTPPVSIG